MGKTARAAGSGVTEALSYIRVSGDEQEREGLSLPAQISECRRYAARLGWSLGTEYRDVMPGKRDDRPQYQAMLADIRRLTGEGRAVVIVTAALDRLGRTLLERVRSREELKKLGVDTHSVRDGGLVTDLVANLLASVAEEEVRRLGERVSASFRHIQASGWHVGRVPWGYRTREATAEERAAGSAQMVLDIDPVTAPYVRELFQRVADGSSIRQAALWAATLPRTARGGRRLSYAAIREIFDGLAHTPNAARRWPEVVPAATWYRAQERIAQHQSQPRQASGRCLLTGFLRCARCGSRMVGKQNKGQALRYACIGLLAGAETAGPNCITTVQGPTLEADVLERVAALLDVATSDTLRPRLRRAWQAMQTPQTGDSARRIARLEADLAKGKKRLGDAALALIDGAIDRDAYALAKARIEADLAGTVAELERLRAEARPVATLPDLETVLTEAGAWPEVLSGADIPATRDVLAKLVLSVTPERIAQGRYRAVITWTPLGSALDQMATALQRAS